MTLATLTELDAIASRLAELLEIDETGWQGVARWLDSLALDGWIRPFLHNMRVANAWATNVVDQLRSRIDMERFPNGVHSLQNYETAEELFWTIFPIAAEAAYESDKVS